MMNSKCCGGKAQKLCPVSFGLAAGIVSFFAVMIWSLWVMTYGMPPMMVAMHIPGPTLGTAFQHALFTLIKGFLFGFFIALIYDLISCCFSCKKSDGKCKCGCGCACCSSSEKNKKG